MTNQRNGFPVRPSDMEQTRFVQTEFERNQLALKAKLAHVLWCAFAEQARLLDEVRERCSHASLGCEFATLEGPEHDWRKLHSRISSFITSTARNCSAMLAVLDALEAISANDIKSAETLSAVQKTAVCVDETIRLLSARLPRTPNKK